MTKYVNTNELLEWLDKKAKALRSAEKPLGEVAAKVIRISTDSVKEARKGRWRRRQVKAMTGTRSYEIIYCSECKTVGDPAWQYCPRCGAEMTR